MATIQLVVFEIDESEYGIDALAVNGILRSKKFKVQKLPGISNVIEGMINLRGHVNYIYNLRTKFGLKKAELADESKFVMINVGSQVVGCIVDEVTDIVKFDEADLQPAPSLSTNQKGMSYLKGIGKVEDRMIIILDPVELLSTEETVEIDLAFKALNN
ncbi:chemotaxis protein CheW [Sporomusa sp.]|uniref:chemotaxis protein CheW n=1 Tax=Sporomusa sp. TaxID=2078658 RepID=UPI002C80E9E8|nr:chemotaxis protein CheW [Sporomusa sp.]HWR42352.1 chemotaxis protein CheW [Sporomusa sp.]